MFGAGAVRAAYDPPPGYYAGAEGLRGQALKAALHARIAGHVAVPYSSGVPSVWTALLFLDADPADASRVLLLYSGESRAGSLQDNGTENANWWNREHVWPLGRGLGSTSSVPGRDLFHLFACDKSVNAHRANYPFDEVAFSPDPEAPLSGSNGAWWHPRDADKGVLARALFYMAVRYEAGDAVDLELAESAGATTMGKLSTLLRWHRRFPPTEAERRRNHRIYTDYQFNRNPFVDNPLFADQVFGQDTPFAAWRRTWFTAEELAEPGVAGDNADPDGDGLGNLLEFAFNLSPRGAQPGGELAARPGLVPAPAGASGEAPRFGFTHRRHRYATDLVFHYEFSADLVSWSEVKPAEIERVSLDAHTERITVEAPVSAPDRFMRLRVERR